MNIKKLFTTVIINILILGFILIFIEIIFGYWFKKDSFSYHMRGKRLQKIELNFDKPNFSAHTVFRRDYYGFREDYDFNDKYNLSNVKIVFNGGSTGEEMFKPYNKTIVGSLNNFLKKDNSQHKIYNASLAGKSLLGKINDFNVWFDKLDNFNPDFMIFYIGVNDRKIPSKRFHDNNAKLNFFNKTIYVVSQKSFFWEKIKKIKDIYFTTKRDGYLFFDKEVQKKIKKGFISFEEASNKFIISDNNEDKVLKNYTKNLNSLKRILNKKKIKPIFITQINYEGNGDKMLFLLNKSLKKFCHENSFNIIKLDEKIHEPINHLFFDEVHVNELGSLYISELIYPDLKKIFLKTNYIN